MADLVLKGTLNLKGKLKLSGDGGKVMVEKNEVLLVVGKEGKAQGTGIPVMIPPNKPKDQGLEVRVIRSFNDGVKVNESPIVAMGVTIQGNKPEGPTWPGMVLTSTNNMKVTINNIPINVKNDSAITLINAGSVIFDKDSGQ